MAEHELWKQIREESRAVRRCRAWVYVAVVAGLAVVLGIVMLALNRKGMQDVDRPSMPVDAMEGEINDEPLIIRNGTWGELMDNINPVLMGYIPESMPDDYTFLKGALLQHGSYVIELFLDYSNDDGNTISIWYKYKDAGVVDMGMISMENAAIHTEEWNGVPIEYMENGEQANLVCRLDNRCLVTITSVEWLDLDQMKEIYDCIVKEP